MSKKEKEKYNLLEQEKNLLKITLDYYAKENEDLKRTISDMKITVKANKDQLNEYISTITNKDMVVEKMNNTITQLRNRLEILEEKNKIAQQTNKYININNNINAMIITNQERTEKNSEYTRENTGGGNKIRIGNTNNNTNNINKNNIVNNNTNNNNKLSSQNNDNNPINSNSNNTSPIATNNINNNASNNVNTNIAYSHNRMRSDDLSNALNQKNMRSIKILYDKLLVFKQKLQNQIETVKEDIYSLQQQLSLLKEEEESKSNIIKISSLGTKFNFSRNVSNPENLIEFLTKSNENEILFMVDSFNRVWEIIMRRDLTPSNLYERKPVYSIKTQAYRSTATEIHIDDESFDTCHNKGNKINENRKENIKDNKDEESIDDDDELEVSRNSQFNINELSVNKSFNSEIA